MKKLVFLLVFPCAISNAQSKETLLTDLSEKVCECINEKKGSKRIVWNYCSRKMLKLHRKKMEQVLAIYKQEGGAIESRLWADIDRILSDSCERYNELIEESFKRN